MSREERGGNEKQYYQVYDGSFRTRVSEDFPDAIRRINKNGKEVFEKEVRALFGFIENIYLEQSVDYGEKIVLELDRNEDGKIPVLSFGIESKDGRDILRKLPNIDLEKEIRISAYRFIPEGEKDETSGISIFQQDENDEFNVKITNFFFDVETKKYLHGFPSIDWDAATEAERKIYKVHRDEFLKEYLKTNIIPKLQQNVPRSTANVSTALDETGDDAAFSAAMDKEDYSGIPF
jgi:hypothetical protein